MNQTERLIEICSELGPAINHKFDVIKEVEPGVSIPLEALSGDHTVGVYYDVIPRKMRDQLSGFEEIGIEELAPKLERDTDGNLKLFLEEENMRGCRFQASWLQYLEHEDWLAYVDEVKYPALEVLGSIHYFYEKFGKVYVYLNKKVPMPLWIRPVTIESSLKPGFPQIVIQARSLQSPIFTNIHTEVSMAYARRWMEAVHGYYKKIE